MTRSSCACRSSVLAAGALALVDDHPSASNIVVLAERRGVA
ncbi:hypothetical protein [Nocardioides convexus]|nr:hypothetical protein [Nocardioides convexus]